MKAIIVLFIFIKAIFQFYMFVIVDLRLTHCSEYWKEYYSISSPWYAWGSKLSCFWNCLSVIVGLEIIRTRMVSLFQKVRTGPPVFLPFYNWNNRINNILIRSYSSWFSLPSGWGHHKHSYMHFLECRNTVCTYRTAISDIYQVIVVNLMRLKSPLPVGHAPCIYIFESFND